MAEKENAYQDESQTMQASDDNMDKEKSEIKAIDAKTPFMSGLELLFFAIFVFVTLS